MGLTRMYQKALRRSETIGVGSSGLGFFILFHVLGVGLVALFFITFPYQETRTENIQLIPGNHTWVRELPIHEFPPVSITYEQDFLRLAGGKETRVSPDSIYFVYLIYEVVDGGKPFQYRQYHDRSIFLKSYKGGPENSEILDGVLIRTLYRDWFPVKILGGLVTFCIVGLVLFITPRRRLPRTKIQPC